MQTNAPIVFTQLLGLSPQLLVYLGGIVLAAIWWRRAPAAAMLAIGGLALMLLSSLIGAGMSYYMMSARGTGATASLAQTMGILSLASSLLRAIGLGMVVAGVFAGRPRPAGRAFEVQPTGGTSDQWSGT